MSDEPLDAYALAHMVSSAGDALVAMALADSVFFSLPVGQAKSRVALYLVLTMAPLAIAAPLLVPLLDRGGYRRAISFAAAAGRSVAAVYAAPRFSTLLLFPLAFALLALSRVHAITKNALTMAYAPPREGLMRANARLGRIAVVGALLAAGPGLLVLKLGQARGVLDLAGVVYAAAMLLTLRLPRPAVGERGGSIERRGRVRSLAAPAAGTAALRGAIGFLLFLMGFALRGESRPTYWFGVLAAAAAGGGFLGDLVAPRLRASLREEKVVIGSLAAAGLGAVLALLAFGLPALALFVVLAGMATEFGRLAFQSLMQRSAPAGTHGRVFVRYEIAFQLAWVAGAFLPAILPIPFRTGVLLLAVFYLGFGLAYLVGPRLSGGETR